MRRRARKTEEYVQYIGIQDPAHIEEKYVDDEIGQLDIFV